MLTTAWWAHAPCWCLLLYRERWASGPWQPFHLYRKIACSVKRNNTAIKHWAQIWQPRSTLRHSYFVLFKSSFNYVHVCLSKTLSTHGSFVWVRMWMGQWKVNCKTISQLNEWMTDRKLINNLSWLSIKSTKYSLVLASHMKFWCFSLFYILDCWLDKTKTFADLTVDFNVNRQLSLFSDIL